MNTDAAKDISCLELGLLPVTSTLHTETEIETVEYAEGMLREKTMAYPFKLFSRVMIFKWRIFQLLAFDRQ